MSSASPPTAITSFRFAKLADLIVDHKHWKNPRTITGLEDEKIAELGKSIKTEGIQVPLIVQKIKSTSGGVSNLVLEGQRRYLAASDVLAKDADIPVVDRTVEVIDLTPEAADDLMLSMLQVGIQREGLSSYELSEVAERLRSRNRSLAEIGRAIGRDESWVSKMLKARSSAQPKLMHQWRKGQVTDEQFKDLAAVKEPEKQAEAVKEVVKLRDSGDSTEARTRAKELAAQFKNDQKKPAAKPEPAPTKQPDLFGGADKKEAPKPRPSRSVLEDMISMADKRPPTHDYVKGLMDGVRYANGDLDPADFGKAWRIYLARIDGTGSGKKKRKAPARRQRAAKARKKTKGKR